MHLPKLYKYNNEDEDNSPNTLDEKIYQASSQKIRRLTSLANIFLSDFIWFQVFLSKLYIYIYIYIYI